MTPEQAKQLVAEAAIEYIEWDWVVGVGTGSTANLFIDELAKMKNNIEGTVASSEASADRLRGHGIKVFELDQVGDLPIYVDGADESTKHLHLIKGGGAALTREKIVAAASEKFICIADDSKLVDTLGAFPLPVEVIPMSKSYVARQLVKLGGNPVFREGLRSTQRFSAAYLSLYSPSRQPLLAPIGLQAQFAVNNLFKSII